MTYVRLYPVYPPLTEDGCYFETQNEQGVLIQFCIPVNFIPIKLESNLNQNWIIKLGFKWYSLHNQFQNYRHFRIWGKYYQNYSHFIKLFYQNASKFLEANSFALSICRMPAVLLGHQHLQPQPWQALLIPLCLVWRVGVGWGWGGGGWSCPYGSSHKGYPFLLPGFAIIR